MRRHYARNTGYSNGVLCFCVVYVVIWCHFSVLAYSGLFWNEPYFSKDFKMTILRFGGISAELVADI